MVKSELQIRAEKAASVFPDAARKPIVIEFAGVPKAGKTTSISQLQAFLKRCGFKTEIVIERASVCPIKDKKHVNFNVWTACTTLAQLLEKTQTPPRPEDPQVLILDRGIFDSLCWLRMMERLKRLRKEEREIIETFLQISDWRDRITGVILMTVSSTDSMNREQGLLPVVGGKGSIMNPDVLDQMTEVCRETARVMGNLFRIFEIDTSTGETANNAKKTAEVVADKVLQWIEELLEEQVLSLPKKRVTDLFAASSALGKREAIALIEFFHEEGTFAPRSQVETDTDRVQALPCVIVRNASDGILRLRRKETNDDNPLHEKIVIWAGGHVRQEDGKGGMAIPRCAVRELEEELRLRVEPTALNLVGAVYIDEGASIAKHVALVYEWKAETNDVAVALSNAEFFERRGTSLSGKFVPITDIITDINKGRMDEQWSDTIIRKLLAKGSATLSPKLL